jgi:hypothetical protein
MEHVQEIKPPTRPRGSVAVAVAVAVTASASASASYVQVQVQVQVQEGARCEVGIWLLAAPGRRVLRRTLIQPQRAKSR